MLEKFWSASDSGSDAVNPSAYFRLPLHLKQFGVAKHQAGWPFVVEHLRVFNRPDGVLLDDFVERSFQHTADRQRWREPWVGIFHHPPNLPEWLDPSAPIQTIISTAEFQASLVHLRGAIALSEYLGGWLRTTLQCPVFVRKYPTAIPSSRFSIEEWEAQQKRRIVQIGWYARNHRAIYQVNVPEGFQKIHLLQDRPWVARAIERTDKFSPYRNQARVGDVDVVHEVNNSQYDYLMSSSVILNQYWDVSASTTIVEAIARSTPLLVNRHPALVEYLGDNYPLFFNELRDVPALLEDPARVRDAWSYLAEMDKSWLSGGSFAQDVLGFVQDVSRTRAKSTKSNTAKPLVSAIIPTYNHGEFVGRALDSILTQQGLGEQFEIEIVVVDDASTDATHEVVLRFPQVRYLRLTQRQGVSAAMNAGIRASTGQYISILGADDTWLPHKLRVQVPLLMANPQVDVLYSQAIRRSAAEDELFPDTSRAPSGRVFEAMLTDNFAGHFASLLIRREAFDSAGYFDEELVTYEDYDMSLRLAIHSQFLFESGPVTIYNLSPHGLWLTRAASEDASKDYSRVIEKSLKMLPKSARYQKMLEEAPIRVAFQVISPFVLAGEIRQAWTKLLEVLQTHPSSVRHQWARDRVRWVIRKRLGKAASPLSEARDLCAQLEGITLSGGLSGRCHMRWILADTWMEILLYNATSSRVSLQDMTYAAIRAATYAPLHVALTLVRRIGRGLLEKMKGGRY